MVKSSTALLTTGILVVVVSLGVWAARRPSPEAGDATAFEQALTNATDTSPQLVSTTTTFPMPAPRPTEPTVSVPRFTVGRHPEGHSRIPVGLQIPILGVDAPVNASGVEANGDMEVPANVTDVGWYKFGPAPGDPGSAVLAAHVDLASQGPGVFFDLRTIEPGDVIHVVFDDGGTEAYRAEARNIYDKTELPTEAIFSREGPSVLTLITCGGGFNPSIGRYDSNVVVYAVPFDDSVTTNSKDEL